MVACKVDQAQADAQATNHHAAWLFTQPQAWAISRSSDRDARNDSGSIASACRLISNQKMQGLAARCGSFKPATGEHVRLGVDSADRLEGGHGVALGAHLHADLLRVAGVVDCLEHKCIVDLAGRRLVAAGMVGELIVTNQIVILANVSSKIPLADLLVVDVEEHLDIGGADGLENACGVPRSDDELPRMVDQNVERLEDDGDPFGLDDPGSGLESAHDGLRLLVARMALGLFARDHADLLDAQLFRDRHRALISSSNSSRRPGSGLVIPWPKPFTGEAEN